MASGVRGEQSITKWQIFLTVFMNKSKFAEEKIARIKPKEYLSSVKKEQTLKLWIEPR